MPFSVDGSFKEFLQVRNRLMQPSLSREDNHSVEQISGITAMQIDLKHFYLALFIMLSAITMRHAVAQASIQAQTDTTSAQLSAKIVQCKLPDIKCIRLSAVNLSNSQSIIVEGDKAILSSPAGNIAPFNMDEVYKLLAKKCVEIKRETQLAASVATAGLASMVVGDAIDKKRGKQEWLGDEAKHRQSDDELFGERIILPLDHTDGLLYFAGTTSGAQYLRIPTRDWPQEEGASRDAVQFIEIPVQFEK